MNLTQFNRILTQTLLLPVLALAFVAAVLFWQVRGAQKTVTTIQASDESIARATLAEKLVIDEETGLRGYQITSDPQFLQPYTESDVPLAAAIDLLRHNMLAQGEGAQKVDAIQEAQKS